MISLEGDYTITQVSTGYTTSTHVRYRYLELCVLFGPPTLMFFYSLKQSSIPALSNFQTSLWPQLLSKWTFRNHRSNLIELDCLKLDRITNGTFSAGTKTKPSIYLLPGTFGIRSIKKQAQRILYSRVATPSAFDQKDPDGL